MKKRGFGEGKINGFGGKIESGETIEAAAKREMLEESGVSVLDPVYAGRLVFEFQGEAQKLEVHVFRATEFEGTPAESDEMKPEWFLAAEPPLSRMWVDDGLWLPLLLAGKCFDGYFVFCGHETIVSHRLDVVPAAPGDPLAILVPAV